MIGQPIRLRPLTASEEIARIDAGYDPDPIDYTNQAPASLTFWQRLCARWAGRFKH
jgi:hypothetical protein